MLRATGTPELKERSAGAPQVRMQCDCNLENCVCECQTATKCDSFWNRAARKGKKIIDQFRGQNAK
eukprot:88755-Pleurochrysis_carterae.AAC.3